MKCALIVATVSLVCSSLNAAVITLYQNFDSDPSGWVGFGNRAGGQDFGYTATNFTGGTSPAGEMGGVYNIGKAAYYGHVFGSSFSLNDSFSASGELIYTAQSADFNAGIRVGYFSSDPSSPDFIGFALLEGCCSVLPARVQSEVDLAVSPSFHGDQYTLAMNVPLTWSFQYNPGGNGTLTFILNGGGTSIISLSAAQRAEGLNVDSFGLSPVVGTGSGEAYFDGLAYTALTPIPEPPTSATVLLVLGMIGACLPMRRLKRG